MTLRDSLRASLLAKAIFQSMHSKRWLPGPHKLKVVQIVSKCRGLPLKDALALAGAPELKAASGTRGQLHSLRAQLEAVGATVEFRPD
ncbi:hypothetical protein JMN21_12525 [Pseudomonas syringae pv. actinidiae]|nr:hypothetical protein IYO_002955 [Pseudomonas syringae pv. actinidiae ICMP 18884]AOE55023.1 hypothetical protein NZ708_02955 [Pseudomonas syringae pv. actinidiae ICMP 18708]APP95885.1 hypothetical protein PsaNZ45_02955 [Pseudomonas syringae pv. actinidiae]AYL79058.1 hypothetical protein CN228_03035 [Pseudomonas syringae pv. actinidiae str. Shaanxi_M228]EPM90831.1 hypothetical protein A3SM_02645 [Pseudomonas syringae pv. actinidiae ICMP 18886]EPN56225.1 hypothetical protein A235_35631 [Pseudo